MFGIKQVKATLFVLVITSLVCVFGVFIGFNNHTKATSSETDITTTIDSAIAISLVNCDASDASKVSVDITPNAAGAFKSACQTATVNTNAPGYTLTARSSSSTLDYLNPTTISPTPAIATTSSLSSAPTTLSNNTWGFAVESRLGFDSSYTIDNANNTYAQLPTADTTIYAESGFPLTTTDHTFYYGVKLDTDTMAGTYATTITYTAVAEEVPTVPCLSDDIICIKVTEPGTIVLRNKWTTPITYSIDGSGPIAVAGSAASSNINVSVGDVIEIDESLDDATFRSWASTSRALVSNTSPGGTAKVFITKMPSMDHFTTDTAGTTAGNNFFQYFAGISSTVNPAAINSLPSGSFDTSNITSVGTSFFYGFNNYGALSSLPAGSFDTSNITTAGDAFFAYFNYYGALTSLPAGSFDTSNITSVGTSFFNGFNNYGALTSLPAGSFDTSNITTAGDYFFAYFNSFGALSSLPDGSFKINSNITTAGANFFSFFNEVGALSSLPAGSFDTSNITSAGTFFFHVFNADGALTSLPTGSFDTSNITTAGDYFFVGFNDGGRLQAGTGVTITNKFSSSVTFSQRPNGDPDGTATNTSVPAGGTITFFGE